MVTQIEKVITGWCWLLAQSAHGSHGAGNTGHPTSGGLASDLRIPESLPSPELHSTTLPHNVTRGGAVSWEDRGQPD